MRENLSALKAQMLGAGFPPLSDGDVRSISTPTLLLTGAHSPAFLLRLTDVLERLLPVAERVEIPAASHAMHEENSAAVNAAILAFLGRQRRNIEDVAGAGGSGGVGVPRRRTSRARTDR